MTEHATEKDAVDYVEACTVACPKCRARVGDECTGWKKVCGHYDCSYRACHRLMRLSKPHMQRAVAARQDRVIPPGVDA